MSLDTHGASGTDGADSFYSTLPVSGSSHSSDIPECYATPISCASLTPPSESPRLNAPHTPLLIPGNPISGPSSGVGLRRACNAALSQSPSSSVNDPGELDLCTEEGVVMREESRSDERRDSRGGQEEGGDPDPGPGEDSSDPSDGPEPSSPPPNDRKDVTRC